MKTPSRSSILAAAAALLISSDAFAKTLPKAEDKPVPPVPAEVRARGGDDVVQWLLDGGYLTPGYLRQVTGEKAHAAMQEGAGKNPLLEKLHSGYESLPATAFKVGVRPTWEAVAAKLTPDVLAKANKLESPRIFGVNRYGDLLIGDGGNEVPNFTLRQNYSQARSAAQAAGLSLMRVDEYRSVNDGSMDVNTWTWLESGDAPFRAVFGYWGGRVSLREVYPKDSEDPGGSRRVLRVKL